MKNKLELFLNGQYANYDDNLKESKTRMPQDLCRTSIFRDLYDFVTSFALWKICDHYKRICGQPTAIEPCTGIFTRTMRLPCAYKIQERLYNRTGGGVLKLEDKHLAVADSLRKTGNSFPLATHLIFLVSLRENILHLENQSTKN